MKKQTIIFNLLFVLTLCMVAPVHAENQALMELLKALQENGTIDKQTYELVKNVAQSESENEKQLAQDITREEVDRSVDKPIDKSVRQKVARSENSIKIGGRIQIDAATYREDNFTLGLNWYATPNIRFAANYVNVVDVEGGANDGDEPEAFQLRTQIEF